MTAITTLRSAIATAIQDDTLYSTYAFPPAMPQPNSVVVSPSDPYIEPNNNQYNTISPMANFRISVLLPLLDNEGNLNGIEQMVVAVFNKLSASSISFRVGTVSAPSVLSTPNGDLLTCEISVSAITEWS
jgi:hypothetical protein